METTNLQLAVDLLRREPSIKKDKCPFCKTFTDVTCGRSASGHHLGDTKLEELVDMYNSQRTANFLGCLKNKFSLNDCVTGCINEGELSTTSNFHSHIHRWREAVIEAAHRLAKELVIDDQIKDFEDLYDRLNKLVGSKAGNQHVELFGALYLYDAAIRIGYNLPNRIMPEKYVYLRSGALEGGKQLFGRRNVPYALKLGQHRVPVEHFLNRFDGAFKKLKTKAGESTAALLIEDFLCVFENRP